MTHTSSSGSFFLDSLSTLPNEDWRRHWPAEKTFLLRMASKRLRAAVDKLHPPASVYLSRTVWADARSGARPLAAISQFVLLQLSAVPSRCRITTLDLSGELPSANVRTRGGRAACGSAGAVPKTVLPRSSMESAWRSRGW